MSHEHFSGRLTIDNSLLQSTNTRGKLGNDCLIRYNWGGNFSCIFLQKFKPNGLINAPLEKLANAKLLNF